MKVHKQVLEFLRNSEHYSEEECKTIREKLREKMNKFSDAVDFINRI